MYSRLLSTMIVQSSTCKEQRMMEYIEKQVKSIDGVLDYHYDKKGNMYVTKGDSEIYPCVVSHTDTVHDIYKDFKIYEDGDVLFAWDGNTNQQVGIGGDDKVGIFITLEALIKFDNIKVAFFVEEESGCNGSREAEMEWFDDVSFVLQCDRKGNSDFVTNTWGTELSSKDFQDSIQSTIKSYGYSFSDGGLTDAVQLKDNGLEVCSANMCCGYYNPHTKGEYIKTSEVLNCLDMVLDLCENFSSQKWEHKYTPHTQQYSRYNYHNDWYNDWDTKWTAKKWTAPKKEVTQSWTKKNGWTKNTKSSLAPNSIFYSYDTLVEEIFHLERLISEGVYNDADMWNYKMESGNTIWEEMQRSKDSDIITKIQAEEIIELMYDFCDKDTAALSPLSDEVEQKELFQPPSGGELRQGSCNVCQEGGTVSIDDTINQAFCTRCMCYLSDSEYNEINK